MPIWKADRSSRHCWVCNNTLRVFNRHHCRYCGNLICNDCSRYRMRVSHDLQGRPANKSYNAHHAVRVCDLCFIPYNINPVLAFHYNIARNVIFFLNENILKSATLLSIKSNDGKHHNSFFQDDWSKYIHCFHIQKTIRRMESLNVRERNLEKYHESIYNLCLKYSMANCAEFISCAIHHIRRNLANYAQIAPATLSHLSLTQCNIEGAEGDHVFLVIGNSIQHKIVCDVWSKKKYLYSEINDRLVDYYSSTETNDNGDLERGHIQRFNPNTQKVVVSEYRNRKIQFNENLRLYR
jgi:hypothetical protein